MILDSSRPYQLARFLVVAVCAFFLFYPPERAFIPLKILHNYYSYHQPRSHGLSSFLALEREGKKRDFGNKVDISSQTETGVVKAIACLENKAL